MMAEIATKSKKYQPKVEKKYKTVAITELKGRETKSNITKGKMAKPNRISHLNQCIFGLIVGEETRSRSKPVVKEIRMAIAGLARSDALPSIDNRILRRIPISMQNALRICTCLGAVRVRSHCIRIYTP
jgi:hypothetical protein